MRSSFKGSPHVSQNRGAIDASFHAPRIYFLFNFRDALIAHSSQTLGRAISQRLWELANWPPLSIAAEEPVSSIPVAVNRAGPFHSFVTPIRCATDGSVSINSRGTCPAAISATCSIDSDDDDGWPAFDFGFIAPGLVRVASTRGVGQPASFAMPLFDGRAFVLSPWSYW